VAAVSAGAALTALAQGGFLPAFAPWGRRFRGLERLPAVIVLLANTIAGGPWVELPAFFWSGEDADHAMVVAEMDSRKLRHDPIELLTRAIQPALWLLIFGQVFARTRAIPSGDLPCLDFMLAILVLLTALGARHFRGLDL
jgi:ABC-2 type transport system permease protein